MSVEFKDYNQQQNWLFPPSIEEMIPPDHPVRIVNGVIEHLDINLLIEQYCKERVPSYHPKMMLKVMVYAYMDNNLRNSLLEKYKEKAKSNLLSEIGEIKRKGEQQM